MNGLSALWHVVADEAVVEDWVSPVVLGDRHLLSLLGLGFGGGDGAAGLFRGALAAGGLGAELEVGEVHFKLCGGCFVCLCLCGYDCDVRLFDM